jgi:hypothetical protein
MGINPLCIMFNEILKREVCLAIPAHFDSCFLYCG